MFGVLVSVAAVLVSVSVAVAVAAVLVRCRVGCCGVERFEPPLDGSVDAAIMVGRLQAAPSAPLLCRLQS